MGRKSSLAFSGALAAACLYGLLGNAQERSIGWLRDLAQAQEQAKADTKPLLVYFGT